MFICGSFNFRRIVILFAIVSQILFYLITIKCFMFFQGGDQFFQLRTMIVDHIHSPFFGFGK